VSRQENRFSAQVLLLGDNDNNQEFHRIGMACVALFVVVMVVVQARIEFDNPGHPGWVGTLKRIFQKKSTNQINPLPYQEALPYKVNVLRICMAFVLVLVVSFFFIMPNATSLVKMMINICIITCPFIAMPILSIWSHDNIKAHSIKKIKSALSINNDPFIIID
jgi:hypothetical protein